MECTACVFCGYLHYPEQTQIINSKVVCQYCIEEDTKTLKSEDVELPLEVTMAQIAKQIEQAIKVIDAPVPVQQTVASKQITTTRQPVVRKSMPVKQEVLDILKAGYTEDNRYYLPKTQLERKLYQHVNEVLERIGGKWTRKVQAHVFEEIDPAQLLELVYESGEMPPKNPTAFFPTPPAVIDYMLNDGAFHRIPSDAQRILEPSAGKGNIAEAVRDYCYQHKIDATIDCCEILPRFQEQLRAKSFNVVDEPDFLAYQPEQPYSAIVMNPPFSVGGDALAYITHIQHAWSLLAPDGVLLAVVPSGFVFREDKRVKQLRDLVEEHGTWRQLKQGAFTASGTGVNTVIISVKKAS